MPYITGPYLFAKVGSGATTCPMAPNPEGTGATMCTMAPDPIALWRGLWRYHVSCGSLWVVSLKHKEKPSWPACAARLACF
jgi:hypothetical protein